MKGVSGRKNEERGWLCRWEVNDFKYSKALPASPRPARQGLVGMRAMPRIFFALFELGDWNLSATGLGMLAGVY